MIAKLKCRLELWIRILSYSVIALLLLGIIQELSDNAFVHRIQRDVVNPITENKSKRFLISAEGDFTLLRKSDEVYYGYSALHSEPRQLIRVFTLYVIDHFEPIYCIFPWSNSHARRAKVTPIANHFDEVYGGLYIDCLLQPGEHPSHVGVVFSKNYDLSMEQPVLFKIVYEQSIALKEVKHALCVPGMIHKQNEDVGAFHEWLLANFYMGVDRFYLYISQELPVEFDNLFQSLKSNPVKKDGRILEVVVIAWMVPTNYVHRSAQTLSVNECLLRAEYRAKFIRFHDFDEILMEFQPDAVARDLTSSSLISSMCYANHVVHGNKPRLKKSDSAKMKKLKGDLIISQHTTACRRILVAYRTKCVVKRHHVDMVAVHHVENTLSIFKEYSVAPFDHAMVFHYRNFGQECDGTEQDLRLVQALPDDFVDKVAQRIWNL